MPAKAEIKGNTIVVWSEQVKDPVADRFAWEKIPGPNLYNKAGLQPRLSTPTHDQERFVEKIKIPEADGLCC